MRPAMRSPARERGGARPPRRAPARPRRACPPPAAASLRADISSGGIETGALIIRRLRREHPGIPVELTEVGVTRGIDLLRTGELDVLLGLAVAQPPAIRRETVRHERVLVGAAADHPIAAHGTV